jgi:EAL domain-containing protein (putative c-di-GMP-specific phosphodiesterase class I)
VRKVARHGLVTVTPILLTSSGIPISAAKVYRSFAGNIEEDARLLTQPVVSLAKALHSDVLAKGAERSSSPNSDR